MSSTEIDKLWDQIETLRVSSKEHGESLSAINEWKRWADEKIKSVCQQVGYWAWRILLISAFGGGAGSFAFSWAS